jgi:hypothetical protein
VEPALRPRHELDSMVASIELTLISVVQGVALYFLTDTARPIFLELRLASLPYLLSGLLIILIFWTRAIIHAVTVIRWPLELGHNFFYILTTLVEAVLFTQLSSPRSWHPIGALLMGVACVMFVYERRMFRLRLGDSAGPQGTVLLSILDREHVLSMRVIMPVTLLQWSASALAVARWPEIFIAHGWHAALGWAQAAGLLGYLWLTLRFFQGIRERVVAARSEWDGPTGGA